jgi:LAO/AO transport system kinase
MTRRPVVVRDLVDGVLAGDRRAVARAISVVEDGRPEARALVAELYPRTGNASVAGFTGPPGVGKSSLISALVKLYRGRDQTVGVVSVDPSSPFSHGALLGDRIRLTEHFLDPGVFIRSMSTRGHLGGVAEATLRALAVLDAAGTDVLLLETVGVGQSEVEVASTADTVVLVLMPGAGDSIQALKAGIMEIPDVIVINKSDHPAARSMRMDIRSILSLVPGRKVPIIDTEAVRGEGVPELADAIAEHRDRLAAGDGGEQRRRRNIEQEVVGAATAATRRRLADALERDPALQALLDQVYTRELDPIAAAQQLTERVLGAPRD